ncbi:MAG TPA: hypothetical protein VI111_09355 [Thermoleophilaceae bacterium]
MSELEQSQPEPSPVRQGLPRWRRLVSWGLIGFTTLLLVFAIAAIWVKRQALDNEYWTDTSAELVENEQIRSTVADYLVDQLFANVDVAGQLQTALPKQLKPLAGPAAGGLRDVATRAANRALEDPRVQSAWVDANSLTHKQFVNLIEDKGTLLKINGNAVVLNLAPLVTEVANRAGIGADVGAKLPGGIAQVNVIKADQISTLQSAVRLLENLVIVLALLVPLLYALAIYLVPGRRRQALLGVGLGIVAAGLLVTLVRGVVGDQIVSSLSSTAAIEPTVQATWTIATSLLGEMAVNTILFGLALVFSAWLAGRSRPATALRRAAAPTLRDRPELAWGALAALLLLFLLIVDIPATRQPYGVLLITAIVCLGLVALRRETAREFPDVPSGGFLSGVGTALRDRRRSLGDGIRTRRASSDAPTAAIAPAGSSERYARLEQLASLHERGVLDDAEFAAEKTAVLSHGVP